jgi:hypothetical protein
MNAVIEAQIQENIPQMKKKEHILHFSCGADSVACHLRMREWGIEPTLIYMYYIDNLPFVENYIKYYEKKMNCHIYKLPSPLFWFDFENGLFQKPMVGQPLYQGIRSFGWGKYSTKTYNEILKIAKPDSMHAKGLRVTDGINRASMLKKKGPIIGDTWYPIASYGFNDIKALLTKHGVKLPIDYSLWGMSFESPRHWMLPAMKAELPESYKMIKKYFPLIGLQAAQDEAIGKGIPGGAMRRISMYQGYAMGKGNLVW